ncbi:MAG TPA: hypothetical protein VLH13_02715, partial [Methanomassiliicoccales archaeon]|nr:hypothetical protein [Methanomassiliicoccales archaeon]
SDALDTLVNKIKRNEFGIVQAELTRLAERTDLRIRQRAEKVVQDAKRSMDQYSGPMDMAEARRTLNGASEALAAGNPTRAYELAQQATESLKKEEIQLLDSRMAEAGRLLAIMKELECESITLKDKADKAQEMRRTRMFNESMRLTGEVIHFANSIIKDELSRQMTNVGKGISIARKKGIEVGGTDRLMEESWRLLNAGTIEQSYNIMQRAVDQLQDINRQHTEIYELLSEVRSLMQEAVSRNLDPRQTEDRLEKAQKLFEAGRYDEAREAGRIAFQDAEKLVAPYIATKRLAEVNELIGIAFKMKLDTTKSEDLLARAEEFLGSKDYVHSLATIREARANAVALMTDGLRRDIAASRGTIEKSKSSGLDMTTAEIMLQKAEGMMQEGRYNDAWRAVELAKSELDQSTFMEQRASDYMRQAEEGIKETAEIGLDVAAAQEMLRQAGTFQRQGNFALATELAKKSYQIACDTAERAVMDKLQDLEDDSHMNGLSGPDMTSMARKKEQIRALVTQHRYKEAMFMIGPFEEELRILRTNRDKARAELEELEKRTLAVEGAGMLSEHSKQMLVKAREKFKGGA